VRGAAPGRQQHAAFGSLKKATRVPLAEHPEVGLLLDFNRGGSCTATLIAPRLALTAAHCVDERNAPLDGHRRAVLDLGGVGYDVDGWRVLRVGATIARHDLAVVHLTRAAHVAPAALAAQPLITGESLTTYGFGYDRCGEVDLQGGRAFQKRVARWRWGQDPEILCDGDSGGPSFAASGALMLVSSRVAGNERDRRDVFTPVFPQRAWVEQLIAAHGQ
jgi:hypothetical protein